MTPSEYNKLSTRIAYAVCVGAAVWVLLLALGIAPTL